MANSTPTSPKSVKGYLGGTARLIEGMNIQFQSTQSALSELVNFARTSTAEQVALGRTQVEELTTVLRGLMEQIQDTAGSSVRQMSTTLTAVVHDLSNRVTELGQQMSDNILESAELATNTANSVIETANTWSSRSAEQLTQLLERHQSHLDRIEEVRNTLDSTLSEFKATLDHYTSVTANLKEISIQVSTLVTSASRATKTIQDTQESMQRVAGLAASQIEQLAEANTNQQEIWQQVERSMSRYQQVFSQVEEEASDLLTQIHQHLNNYTETTRNGFESLVSVANDHFSTATQRLGSSVGELQEYLDDLSDLFSRNRSQR